MVALLAIGIAYLYAVARGVIDGRHPVVHRLSLVQFGVLEVDHLRGNTGRLRHSACRLVVVHVDLVQ